MKVLCVTSGKGGVGKTTLCLNIARQISLRGLRTLIVDFDIHNKGTTGLFLNRVDDSSPSVISIVDASHGFDPSNAKQIADSTKPIPLDNVGNLYLLPATRPREMIRWSGFVAENARIVDFVREFLAQLTSKQGIDVVVIDCYGGIDTLTVAAAGAADKTIIVNEPDVITFSGTLLLYTYLADTYAESQRKPQVHFVINRITSRHSFRFLNDEYEKHLSKLAVSRSILAYFPYDKLILETFGDYPFFSELLPKGLLTQKIRLMLSELWDEEPFRSMAPASGRKRRKIYESTSETPLADPEQIIRTVITAPVWLTIPAVLLAVLNSGAGQSLHYRVIQFAFYFSVLLCFFIAAAIGLFEPVQVTRWLVRAAGFHRRKRRLIGVKSTYRLLAGAAEYLRAIIPVAFSLLFCFGMVGLVEEAGVRFPFRDLRVWPREVYGFSPGRNYAQMKMRPGASIRPGTDFSGAWLSGAQLSGTKIREVILKNTHLNDADLTYADLTKSDLEGADLTGVRLGGAKLHDTNFTAAKFKVTYDRFQPVQPFQPYQPYSVYRSRQGTPIAEPRGLFGSRYSLSLMEINFQGADLSGVNLRGAEMTGARLENARMIDTVLTSIKLIRANLSGAHLNGLTFSAFYAADFAGADLQGADLTRANLILTRLVGANLRGAVLDHATFNTLDSEPDLAEADFRETKKTPPDLLSYAKASGAILDDTQKRIVSQWEAIPQNRKAAAWLQPTWKSPHQKNQEELKKKIERARKSIATSQKDFAKNSAAHDLTEYLMLDGSPDDLSEAKMLLEGTHAVDPPNKLFAEQQQGIQTMQTLLLAVLEAKDDLAAGKAWCDWLDRNPFILLAWSWDTWNANFPAQRYSPKQNAKLRAVQLSARRDMSSRDLRDWYFPDAERGRSTQ